MSLRLSTPFLVLCAFFSPLPAWSQSATVSLDAERVVVPMDHSSGHIQVDVWIGDRGPFLFQVDTYASIDACVDDDLARELGLEVTGTTLNSDGHQTRQRDLTTIAALRLGGAHFADLRVLIDDYDWVVQSDGRRVQGLLGFPLFRTLLWSIDYPGSRLVLERGRLEPGGEHGLAFDLLSGAPDVLVAIGGQRFVLGVDTGMRHALRLQLDDAAGLELFAEPTLVGKAQGAYSSIDVYRAYLAEPLILGGHELEAVPALFLEGEAKRLVGHGLLRSFEVRFDARSQRMELRLPPPAPGADGGEGGEDAEPRD